MSTTVDADGNQSEDGGVKDLLVRALVAVRYSAVLFTATVGTVLVAIGASPFVEGLFAGFFGVWGATALICAGIGFAGVQILKLFDD